MEDPLAEDDEQGWRDFTARFGDRLQVVGDDYLVTNAARVAHAAGIGACNALLIKPNQAGTLSEARQALDASRDAGWGAIVSARSGETEDTTIVHLAIGWGSPQLKVGSFARSERMAKWNEALSPDLNRRTSASAGSQRWPSTSSRAPGSSPAVETRVSNGYSSSSSSK